MKLLSRITAPTTGTIKAKGRIASLLEVGTGFHEELTGRENIYLNGTIMGMKRHEIDAKLDEIVDFAGVERYLDTPVKRYSSGMTVRLGFAVAAFLEPEILVVDEVLAVGDAEFQKKAIGKMNDVATNGGRTVLFVSHNMNSVRQLCRSGVVLKNGMVEMTGTADECVDFYLETGIEKLIGHCVLTEKQHSKGFLRDVEYREVRILNDVNEMSSNESLDLEVTLHRNNSKVSSIVIMMAFVNVAGQTLATCCTQRIDLSEGKDSFTLRVSIPNHQLSKGIYSLRMEIWDGWNYQALPRIYDSCDRVISFEVKYADSSHSIPISFWPNHLLWNFYIAESQVIHL